MVQTYVFYLSILILAFGIVGCPHKDTAKASHTAADTKVNTAKTDTGTKATQTDTDRAVDSESRSTDTSQNNPVDTKISVSYTVGTAINPPIIYAIWLEDSAKTTIQSLYICRRLLNGSLTNTALPYWSMNKLPASSRPEVDAVTGATVQKSNFSVEATIKNRSIRKFTVYVEMDHSFDANDWFDNQPALLYAAEVDLDSGEKSYTLIPVGWTANEGTAGVISGASAGKLQKEMKYITHKKAANGGFGQPDVRSSTKMVGSLTVTAL